MLCGMEKSEKGRRRASSSRGVVGQTRWERKGQGRGEGEGKRGRWHRTVGVAPGPR